MIAANTLRFIECDRDEMPLFTAAVSLSRCLREIGKGQAPVFLAPSVRSENVRPGSILIGTEKEHPLFNQWIVERRIDGFPDGSRGDCYHICILDGAIVIIGANSRAALYGSFRLEEILRQHGGVPQDLHEDGRPQLTSRLIHPRARGDFADYRQVDFEFIARTGGNTALLQHDWMAEKTLFSFVPCAEFPDAICADALANNRTSLRLYLDWCNLYGLEACLWICEMVCQGGPWLSEESRERFLRTFPPEVLSDSGTYQGKVLCLAHPLVKQAYRGMIRQLLRDFPELRMFLVFTQDSNAELCSPDHCERHRGVDKFTQYNELLALMLEEARLVRPDFEVISVVWSWSFRSHPEFLVQQAALPPGAGLATLPDGEAWSFDRKLTDQLRQQRKITSLNGQKLIGYDIFLWGDDTIFPPTELYDFPLGIAAKLRRWQSLGADGIFDQWGTQCEYSPVNALALREMFFDPRLVEPGNALIWAAGLAESLYGEATGRLVFAAWQEIERAQQIQSDHCFYWHHLRPNWAKTTLGTPLTIEALGLAVLPYPEPRKSDGAKDYGPVGDEQVATAVLGNALREAAQHFRGATSHLKAALNGMADAQGEPSHSWITDKDKDRVELPPKQQLEKQLDAVELQASIQQELAHFFSAFSIVKFLSGGQQEGRDGKLRELFSIQREAQESSRKLADLLEKAGGLPEIVRQLRGRVENLPEAISI